MSSSKGPPKTDALAEKCSKSSPGFWEYHSLARDGINVLLNNGFEESQKLFKNHRFEITARHMHDKMSFQIHFWKQAILTFEDDQLDRALENLKRAQRICYIESNKKSGIAKDERLMRQILYADSELYMALLTFLKQGVTDYIKG
ncbi:Tetratricopeptide repeat protein 39C [Exaiptasia diaphana]|nr:Tetratricopeptide repeat protein 39C [Exaiptasia diaphana]